MSNRFITSVIAAGAVIATLSSLPVLAGFDGTLAAIPVAPVVVTAPLPDAPLPAD